MNKEVFLKELCAALQPLSEDERKGIIQDFEEHFMIGKEEGKTEAQIAAALGSPQKIAEEALAHHQLEQPEVSEPTHKTDNTARALLAIIGLGFFNLIIVLGPYLG